MSHSPMVRRLLSWFTRNARDLPWRRTRDPYAVWVSEIMLQQTQVRTVVPYWERWMRTLPDIRSLANASPDRLHKLWEGLGYYTRVRNMQRAAQKILSDHGGRFPEDYDAVLALPGIGRYTAGAVCSIAFNQPKPILDGNVIRVLCRVFGVDGNPRDKVINTSLWTLSETLVRTAASIEHKTVPACRAPRHTQRPGPVTQHATRNTQHAPLVTSHSSSLNQSLMELGALICTPRQPACARCPISVLCAAFQTGRVHELPATPARPKTTAREYAALVLEANGRYLVRQRPAGVVNGQLWEFPNVELRGPSRDALAKGVKSLGFDVSDVEPLCTINHSITRYRIRLRAYLAAARPTKHLAGLWCRPRELRRLAFCSAHKRILQHLLAR